MSEHHPPLAGRTAALRRDFDRSFAEARPPDPAVSVDLLAIRLGSEAYALRLSEITGLFAGRKVVAVPGAPPGLLGIAGFRGAVVPVYDLSALLGQPAAATRWLALSGASPAAFAIGTLEGHLRIAPEAILRRPPEEAPRRHLREFVRMLDLTRLIVDLASVLDEVGSRIDTDSAIREH